MYLEVENIVNDLLEQTELGFCLYSPNGELIEGKGDSIDAKKIVEDSYIDKLNNQTFFKLEIGGKNLIGKIDGVGEKERVLANLITSLALKKANDKVISSKTDFIHALLFGEIDYVDIQKYVKKFKVMVRSACVMLITCKTGKSSDIQDVLIGFGEDSLDIVLPLDDRQCVLIKTLDSNVKDYRTIDDYAKVLCRTVFEETGICLFVALGGVVDSIEEIGSSFNQALAVQRMTKDEEGWSVHSFKEFVLEKMVEDLPKVKVSEYLELLNRENAKDVFNDNEMITTAEAFLENNLNASETSRKLFLHRNTLTYRLDKIEKETGLDIRKFSDAITFRIITILLKQRGKV